MKNLLTISLLCLIPFKTYANVILTCNSTDYRMNPEYSEKWGKSWVPRKHEHLIKNNVSVYKINGQNIIQTNNVKNTNDRIKVRYRYKMKNQNYTDLNFIFFKTNNKFSIEIGTPGGYISPGDVWGRCDKSEKNSDTTKPDKNINSISKKTLVAENKCSELGFTPGTENFGNCVLKLLEQLNDKVLIRGSSRIIS